MYHSAFHNYDKTPETENLEVEKISGLVVSELSVCICFFPHGCDQILIKLKGERFYCGSWFKGTVHQVEKAWWQEHEADGHVASAVWKQREMDAGAPLTFSIPAV